MAFDESMRTIGIRFHAWRFSLGAALLSIGSGAATLEPRLLAPAAILFVAGAAVTVSSLVTIRRRAVVLHNTWDHHRIYRALEKAPGDAVVKILQTWIPEEDFVAKLQELLAHNKQFDLRVLLMEHDQSVGLVRARVQLRGIKEVKGVDEIRSTVDSLVRMKDEVEQKRKARTPPGRKAVPVDLEIRQYSFLPFGPIYQVAEDVMFVGLYLNYATSGEGPMLEVRNTGGGNRLWRILEHHFEQGWAAPGSRIVFPEP